MLARTKEHTTLFHRFHHGALNGPLPWLHFALTGFFWLALLGLVIAAIVALTRRPRLPSVGTPTMGPLDILSARYARGEIDAATYEEMRNRILGNTPPTTTL